MPGGGGEGDITGGGWGEVLALLLNCAYARYPGKIKQTAAKSDYGNPVRLQIVYWTTVQYAVRLHADPQVK